MLFLLTLGVVWAHTDCTPNHFSFPPQMVMNACIDMSRQVPQYWWFMESHPTIGADLNEERSIATTLTAQHLVSRFTRPWLCRAKKGWGSPTTARNFDMYGTIDVHTAIQFIQAETGFSQVAYIGHSMGGHVATAYLAEHGNEAVYALVVVGSPVDFGDLEFRFKVGRVGAFWGSGLPTLPSPWAANQAARFNRFHSRWTTYFSQKIV